MRRKLFGKNPEAEWIGPKSASASEALLFDIREHESSTDSRLAELRVDGWAFVPWLLLAGHLIVGANLLVGSNARSPAAILAFIGAPLAIAIGLDVVAGIVLDRWRRLQLAPHTVGRLTCGYVAAVGVCSTLASGATQPSTSQDANFAAVALAAGFLVRSVASVASPPLAVVNAVITLCATLVFSTDPLATRAAIALAVLVVVYTLAVTRKTIAGGRKRLGVEWQARKALNFVSEFE